MRSAASRVVPRFKHLRFELSPLDLPALFARLLFLPVAASLPEPFLDDFGKRFRVRTQVHASFPSHGFSHEVFPGIHAPCSSGKGGILVERFVRRSAFVRPERPARRAEGRCGVQLGRQVVDFVVKERPRVRGDAQQEVVLGFRGRDVGGRPRDGGGPTGKTRPFALRSNCVGVHGRGRALGFHSALMFGSENDDVSVSRVDSPG
ncbi:hypothetical protein DFJ74DRAFT_502571, partial [Hyaloraphidium curvatum]